MGVNELILLRRKEIVGTISVIAWGIFLILALGGFREVGDLGVLAFLVGWTFAAYWVALDARYRSMPIFWWTVFALAAGPVALLFYFVSRTPAPPFCSVCGTPVAAATQVCPTCGRQISAVNRIFSTLTESLAPGPLERAKHTAKCMAIALAAFVLFGMAFGHALGIPEILGVVAIAAYWVLVPWWVYLDAMWRRMDAVPWAILTLLTNVFGLVTYLVIRYPDPRACSQCGAYLTVGLKRCPYCGSEAERTCPRCQASVKADWVYCPACASQLPAMQPSASAADEQPDTTPLLTLQGTVTDAATKSPIPGAEVRVDSKREGAATTTDPLGRFVLADLDPRPYVILASAKGYAQDAKAYIPSPAGAGRVDLALYPAETGKPTAHKAARQEDVSGS